MRRHPYSHILEKMRREVEESHRRAAEEERRRWREAERRFKEIIDADRRYSKELEAEIYELSIEEVLKMHRVKPLFKDLRHLAEHCTDAGSCYRMLTYLKLKRRDEDLHLVKEAVKIGADVELLITLLYNGKREEAAKLLRR